MGRKKKVKVGEPLHIVSFSGGKDSTAMLLMMIEKGMHIDEIVFCDTGVEHPEAIETIRKVEKDIGREILFLRAEHDYFYYLTEKECSDGTKGYGHPTPTCRWCTGHLKIDVMSKYYRSKERPLIVYIGIAADEAHRTDNNKDNLYERRHPLVDWNVTEAQALKYCYDKGYDWGGLYNHLTRISCWCCPLMSLADIKFLYRHRPKLWQKLKEVDAKAKNQFKPPYTMEDLELISNGEYLKPRQAKKYLGVQDGKFRAIVEYLKIESRQIGGTKIKWYKKTDIEKVGARLDELFDLTEASKFLNKSRYGIEYLVQQGRIKKYKYSGLGTFFVKKELEEYKEQLSSELSSKQACEFLGFEWKYFKELMHRRGIKLHGRKGQRPYFKMSDLEEYKYNMETRRGSKQACEFLEIPYTRLKAYVSQGRIQKYEEPGKHPYFLVEDLERLKEELENEEST